jgi:A/G-specific adenine glycosylase
LATQNLAASYKSINVVVSARLPDWYDCHVLKCMKLPPAKDITWFRTKIRRWSKDTQRDLPWRNPSASEYVKVLSEVLLQRTRAEVVASFLPAFIRRYPSWDRLARTTRRDLGKFLQPLGLWRRRAVSLKRLAKEIVKRGGRFPTTREEVEKLPNVGQYIANAILLFCHREAQPLLDVNMARVLERFFGPRKLADIRYDPYLQSLSRAVVSSKDPIVVNWAILDHAMLVCKISKPLCATCPVVRKCKFAKASTYSPNSKETLSPVRSPLSRRNAHRPRAGV